MELLIKYKFTVPFSGSNARTGFIVFMLHPQVDTCRKGKERVVFMFVYHLGVDLGYFMVIVSHNSHFLRYNCME